MVSFKDPVLDGKNMENTDLFEWTRRPGFSIFCSQALANEIINDFYSFRDVNGTVWPQFDSTERWSYFNTTSITTLLTKTTTNQGYVTAVGNGAVGTFAYFSDGSGADLVKWAPTRSLSSVNPSPWGLAAPTRTPTVYNTGCWLPKSAFVVNNAVLDPNGNVEVVTKVFGSVGLSGNSEPIWPSTTSATVADGSLQWTNMGPLLIWYPATNYPTPAVIVDTNGNLQLATTANNAVSPWNNTTNYAVGVTVFFGGNYWTCCVTNTNVPPSSNGTTTSGGITQPYWVLSQNPIVTGFTVPASLQSAASAWNSGTPYIIGNAVTYNGYYWACIQNNTNEAPAAGSIYWQIAWNPTIGGQTADGSFIWVCLGPGQLIESFGTSYVCCFRTIYGHLTTASPVSSNTGSIFGPKAATITSFQIASNIVTFQGANNFIPGNIFTVTGMTTGTYLNNQSFTVIASGLSATQFSAVFNYQNVPSTADYGVTASLVAQISGVGATLVPNAVVTITATAVSNNVVTVYAINDFETGLQVSFSGLVTAAFLNGQTLEIVSVDPNGQFFTVNFTASSYSQTNDSGTATAYTTAPICNAMATITGLSISADVVTIYAANNFVGGLWVTLTGLTGATFLNNQQLQIIAVDPNGTWFQVYYVTDDQTFAVETGTATFNAVEIYRTSDGGGIYLFAGAVTNPTTTVAPSEYDSGVITATVGIDNGAPGTYVWSNPGNVSSATNYASVTVPAPGGGGVPNVRVVQSCQMFNSGPPSESAISATFTLPVIAGNSIVVFTNWLNTHSGITLSDTNGNSYSQVGTFFGNNTQCSVYMANNVSGGTTTVMLGSTSGNGNWLGFQAFEVAGLDGTVQASAHTTNGNHNPTVSIGPVTPSTTNNAVFTFMLFNNNQANQPGAPPTYTTTIGTQTIQGDSNIGSPYLQMTSAWFLNNNTNPLTVTWTQPSLYEDNGWAVVFGVKLYTAPSDGLNATNFNLNVPTTTDVSGIQVQFDSFFTGTAPYGVLQVQLLRAGAPYGSVVQVYPTGTNQTFTIGPNLWGVSSWAPADLNSSQWGVQFTAAQLSGGTNGTFNVRNVRADVTGKAAATGWYFDDFITDADLDALLIAPQAHQNDPPPGAAGSTISTPVTITKYWNGRIWMVSGNYVYFTAGPDCTNGIPEESCPPANRFQFAGPPLALVETPDGSGLLVVLADRVNAILGGPETISFYPTDALSNFGISSSNCIFKDGSTLGFFTTQKQFWQIVGTDRQQTGEHISDYLSENFTPQKTYITIHRNGTDDGMFLSNGVDRIVRYGMNVGSWSVPAFPVFPPGALRSIETSVGVQSLLLAPNTAGENVNLGPKNPMVGQSVGSGAAWQNPNNITLGNPTSYAISTVTGSGTTQSLQASQYSLNLPIGALITGIQVSVTGYAGTGTPLSPSLNNQTNTLQPTITSNAASFTVTPLSGGPTINVGDTGVIYIFSQNATANSPVTQVSSVTDNFGNVWTQAGATQVGQQGAGLASAATQVFYAPMQTQATHASPLTITMTFINVGGSSSVFVGFGNIVNVSATPTIVQQLVSGASPSSGSVSPTAAAVLFSFAWGHRGAAPNLGIPTGWTEANINDSDLTSNPGWGTAWESVAAGGPYTDQWSGGAPEAGTYYTMTLVSFPILCPSVSNTITILPVAAVSGATSYTQTLPGNPSTFVFGGPTSLWNMPSWISPQTLNGPNFGFSISGTLTGYLPVYLNAVAPWTSQVVAQNSISSYNWTFNFPATNYTSWANNSFYAVGTLIKDSNGNVQRCTTAGNSGSTQPSPWPTAVGVQTSDGSAVWTSVIYAVSEGDTLILFRGLNNTSGSSGTISSISDTLGDTWTRFSSLPLQTSGNGTPMYAEAWYTRVASNVAVGGTITFTITFSTTTSADMWIQSISNLGTPATQIQASGTSATSWSSGTISAPASQLFAFSMAYGYAQPSTTYPFTAFRTSLGSGGYGTAYYIPAASGTISDSWSQSAGSYENYASQLTLWNLVQSSSAVSVAISEVQVKVYYQTSPNYIFARNLTTWQDAGSNYSDCYVTLGSITLAELGAIAPALQHVVGYFDAVGTLGGPNGGSGGASYPNVWILPNEISDTGGQGFVQLPEVLPEPSTGQNAPSGSLLALRWPLNMANTEASQIIHHLQVKIGFESENAPNTIKAIAFKGAQE